MAAAAVSMTMPVAEESRITLCEGGRGASAERTWCKCCPIILLLGKGLRSAQMWCPRGVVPDSINEWL